ncbi:hypothetical protein SUGI_0760740 [Cryptomeria japonica]|uniref:GDSL esterase/lipase At2g42990 n=1 Tax=Cryptomeria japonica TaxID=3369 RepID=UPI002414AC53|nr:GDSL esterase/lipase At2g42990 [Cryptomeria japonica]GLJ37441.1 hypothetical protein SUGI_0760740 [Cryptomeria japonica]
MRHPTRRVQYVLFLLCIIECASKGSQGAKYVKPKVPALFTFGDSIVDPGNNDFIATNVKSNHPPYGMNFNGNRSTGRCSNGKLSMDFLVEALGIKETLPPYLDPDLTIHDLLTGVSFGSAGSGYDNLTAMAVDVIPMWKQAELFRNYKARVEEGVGSKNTSNLISQALYVAVAGTNDFVQNYFYMPIRRKEFKVEQYGGLVIHGCKSFLEELYKLGARKIAVFGLPPIGCLPVQKTILKENKVKGCIKHCNKIAVSYNRKLNKTIEELGVRLPGIKLVYVDIYAIVLDLVNYPAKYGFEAATRGCCGTGMSEIGLTCNSKTPVSCKDPAKYVFWDAVHLTERAYHIANNIALIKYYSKLL